jgi:predicted transposase/invertase (TIGR01784 family)
LSATDFSREESIKIGIEKGIEIGEKRLQTVLVERFRNRGMHEDIFKELCKSIRIKKLKPAEMEKYKQSLMDYGDVISVARQSRKEGREEGIAIGEKQGIAKVVKRFYNQGKSIKEIAELLGFTEEQVYNLLE